MSTEAHLKQTHQAAGKVEAGTNHFELAYLIIV